MKGRKLGLKSVIWNKSKKEASNWNRMKKQEFKKMKRFLNLWDNLKCSNIRIIGVQKEKNNSKKLKTYLNK